MKKRSFKRLRWNVKENCDVDVAIDHASYESKKTAGKRNCSSSLIIVPLSKIYFINFFSVASIVCNKKIFTKKL